jgi:hypothetical protein
LDEATAVEWIAQVSSDVREQTQAMRTANEAQGFVDEVVRIIGESPIDVRVIDREQADAFGHKSPDWKGDRVAGASDPPHGPQFTRGWIDLMRRFSFYEIAAHSIEFAFRLYGVPIDDTPSRLAKSNLGE